MYFLMVVVAALAFSAGGIAMKLSEGLTRPTPAAVVFLLFALGAALQAVAMKHSQMSVTYLIVLGLEAVTAFTLGVVFLKEDLSGLKIAGVVVIVLGIAMLRLADLQAEARPPAALEPAVTGVLRVPTLTLAVAYMQSVGGVEHFETRSVKDTHAEHLEFHGRGLRIIVKDRAAS